MTKRDPYRLTKSTLLGKYRLDEYAGGGGMGAVYRSFSYESNDWVAVKILKPDIVVKNPGYVELFQREVEAARALLHPHIVRVLDNGSTDDDISFMVMEWLEGQTLEDALTPGQMPLDRILFIFKQICSAFSLAHSKNIIHLDVKPANIFLLDRESPDDFVKVIDFGMARILKSDSGTTVTRFLGTYQYCSPEHFGGKVSSRSDIYSLGVTLYQMITGLLPFGTSYINAKMHRHLELPAIPSVTTMRPEVSTDVDDVIRRALEKDSLRRQESVEQLFEEFSSALGLAVEVSQTSSIPSQALAELLPSQTELPVEIDVVAGREAEKHDGNAFEKASVYSPVVNTHQRSLRWYVLNMLGIMFLLEVLLLLYVGYKIYRLPTATVSNRPSAALNVSADDRAGNVNEAPPAQAASGEERAQPINNPTETQTGARQAVQQSTPEARRRVRIRLTPVYYLSLRKMRPVAMPVTLITSAGRVTKTVSESGYVQFDNVPCGERVTLLLSADGYQNELLQPTNLKPFIGCDKQLADLGEIRLRTA